MRTKNKFLAAALAGTMMLLGACGGGGQSAQSQKSEPVSLTLWHYYNGAQQQSFDRLVTEFNEGEGREQGIYVDASSQGSVTDLQQSVLDAAEGKVGAPKLPSIFAAYADTAYAVDQLGLTADLAPYFTSDELAEYVDGYIAEGRFAGDDSLKIFPVAKSTEILMLNKTDWDSFAEETGADASQLSTIEGVTALAQQYYEWTDAKTPEPNDGMSFFGRDAMANYFLVGARQLGMEIFEQRGGETVLNFDKAVVRRLWDNFYVPFLKGYFGGTGRFRSDDVKVGKLLCFVGSSSGAAFFPDAVIMSDDEQRPIEVEILPAPIFADGEAVAVQQGAGMVVTSADENTERAAATFLKWFTEETRNSAFSIESGYLPVKKKANDMEFIRTSVQVDSKKIESIVSVGIETVNASELYTPRAFANGTQARAVLENSMTDAAKADRAVVQQQLQAGQTLDAATAPYLTDAYFDAWYESTEQALRKLIV